VSFFVRIPAKPKLFDNERRLYFQGFLQAWKRGTYSLFRIFDRQPLSRCKFSMRKCGYLQYKHPNGVSNESDAPVFRILCFKYYHFKRRG